MKFTVGFMGNDELDGKTFDKFSEAARAVLKGVEEAMKGDGLPRMIIEEGIWIETEVGGRKKVMKFFDVRDFAFEIGLLKESKQGHKSFIFADEEEFSEPDDTYLKQAFIWATNGTLLVHIAENLGQISKRLKEVATETEK